MRALRVAARVALMLTVVALVVPGATGTSISSQAWNDFGLPRSFQYQDVDASVGDLKIPLDNYAHMLRDGRTWDALFVTLKFAAIALPIGLLLPFAIALLLNSGSLRGSRYFDPVYFCTSF